MLLHVAYLMLHVRLPRLRYVIVGEKALYVMVCCTTEKHFINTVPVMYTMVQCLHHHLPLVMFIIWTKKGLLNKVTSTWPSPQPFLHVLGAFYMSIPKS